MISKPDCLIWDWQGTLSDGLDMAPDANNLVELFAKEGVKQVVVSNARRSQILPFIREFKWADKIELVVGVDMNMPPKPAAAMLLYAMKELDVKNTQTLFIGDTIIDMQAAKNANCYGWHACDGLEEVWQYYKQIYKA